MRGVLAALACTALMLGGCAGSDEGMREEAEGYRPVPETPTSVSFEVRSDTVDVLRRGERGSGVPAASGEIQFSVQIGAFRDPTNAAQAEDVARSRFSHPVLRHLDPAGLHHIRVGRFSTRTGAETFRDEMLRSFPGDYADCWIVQLTGGE